MIALLVGIGLTAAGLTGIGAARAARAPQEADWTAELIRLHVIGHSDLAHDQALKRAVRDALLQEMAPLLTGEERQEEAAAILTEALPRLQARAAAVIAQWGESYGARAELGRFRFPGRVYGNLYLPAGEYTALKISLGEASGANWWCVLFPPLCFVDWATGLVLEQENGESRPVSSRELYTLLDQLEPEQVEVRGRSALLEWWRRMRAGR